MPVGGMNAVRPCNAPLEQSLERQLGWARDYAGVGDYGSAAEALRDAAALAAEFGLDAGPATAPQWESVR